MNHNPSLRLRMKPSTRKVLERLRAADGGWVRGNDLAEVGGFRFGGRIHELRHDYGHRIERAHDPTSAVDRYRLLPPDKPHKRPVVAPGQVEAGLA